MKTSRYGLDIKPELGELARQVNREVAEVYKSRFSEEAFRRVKRRLDEMMREAGKDQAKRSIVQGGYNDLADARVAADQGH